MKAHLVSQVALGILLVSTSYAGPPKTGSTSKTEAQAFDARTGQWRPAGPKPIVTNDPPSPAQLKAQRAPLNLKTVAMLPVQAVVTVAKVPLMPDP